MTDTPCDEPTSNHRRVEGIIDGLVGDVVRGWAWYPEQSDNSCIIEVNSDKTLLARGEANVFRADLAAAGKREGYCGFELSLDHRPDAGALLTVNVVNGNGDRERLGNALTAPVHTTNRQKNDGGDVLPKPISHARLHGSLDQCGPSHLRGWVRWLDDTTSAAMLSLYEGDHERLRFEANQWRADIAEIQQGDGCCGFDVLLPDSLRDGQLHTLELRIADANDVSMVLPFRMHIASAASHASRLAAHRPAPLQRSPTPSKVTLSIVVNFYNMQREAARTLTSLSRDYQLDSADLDYEVLCIDNGSSPPMDPNWVAAFGPQFRLIRPSHQLSSPCAALNEAALQARGQYLALMIDGAHLLTPGTFREALGAWRAQGDAVVALRHWFIGGDQRWLTMVGYSREQEDQLFERIRWPANGYDLFRIGAPIGELPEPWFDGINESNCLMLPAALYDAIGGFDEGFDQPGGGFANLDLWRRASEAAKGPLVSLIGEASFHQFHGGTTTNVDDDEKDFRVRVYANAYRSLRGEDFRRVPPSQLNFRGRLSSEFAIGIRQRSLMPMRLGITNEVRPGQLSLHLDDGAQAHLQSVYAECRLQHDVRWLGQPVGVAPADLVSIQEILHRIQPDAIIAVGIEPGLVQFILSILPGMGCGGTRVLHVTPPGTAQPSAQLTVLEGSPSDPSVLATARQWTGSAEVVMVLHAVGSADRFSLASLQAYGELVSYRSYMVCVGTLFGQPWLGYSHHQHLKTLRDFTSADSPFVIDRGWTRQLITTCPSGYLRKVGGGETAATCDASLDTYAEALPLRPENLQ